MDRLRPRRFPWLFGILALSLTVPVVAGGLRPWSPDRLSSPSGQAAGSPPSQIPTQGRASTPADGQRSRPEEWEWWNDAAVKKELGLTDAKSKEIDRIFQDRARHAKPFSDQLNKEREEQNRMAKERLVDEGTFALQVARADALFSELRKSRAVMVYRISRKLTAEQIKKLEEIRDRRSRDGRGRGAGSR